MRLEQYLTEEFDADFEKTYDILKRDCLKFLKESKGLLLYRGTNKGVSDRIVKRSVRQNRLPLDMPLDYHREFDKELYKKFHWYPRTQGVFATSDSLEAGNFGLSYLFFPIGNYKYVWSSSYYDIWVKFKQAFPEIYSSSSTSYKHKEDHLKWIKNAVSTYINNKLYDAIVAGHEISFKCDNYYLVNEYYGYGTYFSQKYVQEIRKK